MSRDVGEVLRGIARALDERGIRWYVFGAQAVLAHGLPRLTADLDLTIEPGQHPTASLLDVLTGADVAVRDPSFAHTIAAARLLPLIHRGSGLPIDVVLTHEGIELDFMDRRVRCPIGGVDVPVLSVEDLLATKAMAGRPKDEADILGVLQMQHTTLRLHELRAVLRALDEALEEPRASERFERLYRRFQRERAR